MRMYWKTIILTSLLLLTVVSCVENGTSQPGQKESPDVIAWKDSINFYKDSINRIFHKYYIFKYVYTSFEKVDESNTDFIYQFNLSGGGMLMADSIVYSNVKTIRDYDGVYISKKNDLNIIKIDKTLEQDSVIFYLNFHRSKYYSRKFLYVYSKINEN